LLVFRAGELELESDKSEKVKADNKNRRHMIYLAVAYAANTGKYLFIQKSNLNDSCLLINSRWDWNSDWHRL